MVYTVFASLKIDSVPKLSTSSKKGRTYTVYVPAPMLELISGPRTRIGLVSGALVAAVINGLMVTVGGEVAMFTTFEAARLKSMARRTALDDA